MRLRTNCTNEINFLTKKVNKLNSELVELNVKINNENNYKSKFKSIFPAKYYVILVDD
jgi:hypothetical protein